MSIETDFIAFNENNQNYLVRAIMQYSLSIVQNNLETHKL